MRKRESTIRRLRPSKQLSLSLDWNEVFACVEGKVHTYILCDCTNVCGQFYKPIRLMIFAFLWWIFLSNVAWASWEFANSVLFRTQHFFSRCLCLSHKILHQNQIWSCILVSKKKKRRGSCLIYTNKITDIFISFFAHSLLLLLSSSLIYRNAAVAVAAVVSQYTDAI